METTIIQLTNKNIILIEFSIIGSIRNKQEGLPFLFDVTQKYFEKDSDNLSELGSLERDIEQKKVILLQKGADVNKRNSSSGTVEN